MFWIALALGIAQQPAPAPPPEPPGFDPQVIDPARDDRPRITILCDPVRYRFSIRASADAATLDRSYPRRLVIDPATLIAPLPGATGEDDIRGFLIRYVTCGPYALRLAGDAYNANVQGESGAYPEFATISITSGARWVYPALRDGTRLTDCDRALPRARPCPIGYAIRLDGAYDARTKKLVLTETRSSYDTDVADARGERQTLLIDDDVSLWRVRPKD
ncbi:hypothetical protein ACFOKI_08360 [Sphingomonas qilianensis]|uniref:Uncharacterized protein n=1 Tax=Sphingomonas qilianensis TaxID=1736690 RepID=A0ABU9XTK3_9SPHN